MIEKRTIFDFFEKVFLMYGITIIIFIVLTYITGDETKEVSTLFSLGRTGISLPTLVQLLGMSVVIAATRFLFFTDAVFKNMTIPVRTVLMLITIVLVMTGFMLCFNWFDYTNVEAWIGFFVSFGLCFVFSMMIAILREKCENKKMSDALKKLKADSKKN